MKHQSIATTATTIQRANKVENNLGLSEIVWRKLAKTLKLAKPLKELTCGEKTPKATAAVSLLEAFNSSIQLLLVTKPCFLSSSPSLTHRRHYLLNQLTRFFHLKNRRHLTRRVSDRECSTSQLRSQSWRKHAATTLWSLSIGWTCSQPLQTRQQQQQHQQPVLQRL